MWFVVNPTQNDKRNTAKSNCYFYFYCFCCCSPPPHFDIIFINYFPTICAHQSHVCGTTNKSYLANEINVISRECNILFAPTQLEQLHKTRSLSFSSVFFARFYLPCSRSTQHHSNLCGYFSLLHFNWFS